MWKNFLSTLLKYKPGFRLFLTYVLLIFILFEQFCGDSPQADMKVSQPWYKSHLGMAFLFWEL